MTRANASRQLSLQATNILSQTPLGASVGSHAINVLTGTII